MQVALHGGVHPTHSQRRGQASGVEARSAVHLGSCPRLAAGQAKVQARGVGHARQLGVAVFATAAPTTAGPSSSTSDDSGLFDVVVVGAGISGLTTAQARTAPPPPAALCPGPVLLLELAL